MARKQTRNKFLLNRYSLTVITTTAIVVFFVIALGQLLHNYNFEADQNRAAAIRETLMRSTEAMKQDAPIDPRTGDTYFPESKLYLPYDSKVAQLTYSYDDADTILSISSKPILRQSSDGFYNAMDASQVFERLPYLNACQRGVDLLYTKQHPNTDKVFKQTLELSNGKTLYVFSEKQCPLLDDLTAALKNIRAY